MLKRKSSKLMSGTGAVAIVASLGSMSTAAENISDRQFVKMMGTVTGLIAGLCFGFVGETIADIALADSDNAPHAKIFGGIFGMLGYILCGELGELVGQLIASVENSKVKK